MIITGLKYRQMSRVTGEVLTANDVRSLIATHLGVDFNRVTDEAHFSEDLGADWLDRLELIMAIEDQLADLAITDEDADQIQVVGDLIRHIEKCGHRGPYAGVLQCRPFSCGSGS